MAASKGKAQGNDTPAISGAPPPPPPPDALSPLDRWYLDCLTIHCRHLKRAPSVLEFATWIKRTTTPVHRKLTQLEAAGYVTRDDRRRFLPRTLAPEGAK